MAVPYELLWWVAVLVVIGLAGLWLIAPRLAARSPAQTRDFAGRSQRIRIGSAALLVALVAVAVGARAAGAPLAPSDQPLVFGHAYGGDDPRLIALVDSNEGPQYDYAFAPGAEIRIGITLSNNGSVPLTVTGLAPEPITTVRALELRLPPGELTADLVPAYPDEGSDRWASEPFHAFDVPAHGEIGLVLAVTIGTCPAIPPVPTLAPEASLLPGSDPSLAGTVTGVGELNFEYVAVGIARTAAIELPFSMVVIGTPGTFGCPSA